MPKAGSPAPDAPGRPATDATLHEHRSVSPDRRVWLEASADEAASMRLHAFCVDCGAVRSELPFRGRPLGYFERTISNLKADLEDHPKYAKLARVHSHLIAQALRAVPDFGDPYSMDFETQWTIFVQAVGRVRPDLPADLVEAARPREPRRHRPAFIDLIAASQGRRETSS